MSTSNRRGENPDDQGSSFSSLSSPMSSPPASPSAQLSNEKSHALGLSKKSTGPHDSTPKSGTVMTGNNESAQPPQDAASLRKKPGRKPKPVDPNDPIAVKKAIRNAQRTAKRQSAKEAERASNPPPPAPVAPAKRKKTSTTAVVLASSNDTDGSGGSSKIVNGGGNIGGVSKKQLQQPLHQQPPPPPPPPPHQAKITEMGIRPTEFKPVVIDVPVLKSNAVAHNHPASSSSSSSITQNGKSEGIPNFIIKSNDYSTQPPPPPAQTTTRPLIHRSPSGQNYDPVRSNFESVRETVLNQPIPFTKSQTSPIPPHSVNRASASPSISSLVDPPNHISQSPSQQSFLNQQAARQQHPESQPSIPPSSPTHAPSPMIPTTTITTTTTTTATKNSNQPAATLVQPVEMSGSFGSPLITKKQVPLNSASTASSSTTHSPKPMKGKDPAPPPLPGSLGGLLQNGMLGDIGASVGDSTEFRAPTIILHIPMNGDTNKCINFTKLAEDHYGWDALHPRQAAQRDRLARVAAAGAALEKSGAGQRDSGDEMSLDLSEGEGSNAELGDPNDDRTGTDGGKKPTKKRKSKEDEYDKYDGFVDDSDMLWEMQAAASKDGFFVYSGPLVPEVEKPTLERSQSGPNKRSRARAKGSTTKTTSRGVGNASAAATTAAAAAPAATTATGANSSSTAKGSSIIRKPRITKVAKQQLDFEKLERERMGMHASTYAPNIAAQQVSSSLAEIPGGTQMVFGNNG